MKLNKKLLSMLLIGTMTAGTLSLSAASLTKTAQLFYNNIRVKVDGEYRPTNVEPFMINGTVYVSLRDAAELTNNNVNWNKLDQSVEISRGVYKPSDYEQELATKNAEIMKLRSQLERLQNQLDNGSSSVTDLSFLFSSSVTEEEPLSIWFCNLSSCERNFIISAFFVANSCS